MLIYHFLTFLFPFSFSIYQQIDMVFRQKTEVLTQSLTHLFLLLHKFQQNRLTSSHCSLLPLRNTICSNVITVSFSHNVTEIRSPRASHNSCAKKTLKHDMYCVLGMYLAPDASCINAYIFLPLE